MSAIMKIDQAGISSGTAGVSRNDGVATGALVTLTSTAHVATFSFKLLHVGSIPYPDLNSRSSLKQASATTWTFTPTSSVSGVWLIELTTDAGTHNEASQVLSFGIKSSTDALVVQTTALATHVADTANPHAVTLNQVGLVETIYNTIGLAPEATLSPSGIKYLALVGADAGVITLQFMPKVTGTANLSFLYSMSTAEEEEDVELTLSKLAVTSSEDPSAALVAATAFVFTPSEDTNMHTLNAVQSASLSFAVTTGTIVKVLITRSIAGNDTHTGDLRIISTLVTYS